MKGWNATVLGDFLGDTSKSLALYDGSPQTLMSAAAPARIKAAAPHARFVTIIRVRCGYLVCCNRDSACLE